MGRIRFGARIAACCKPLIKQTSFGGVSAAL
jgi:hypothetical protein